MIVLRTEVEHQKKELEEYTCSFQKLGLKRLQFKKKGHTRFSPTICVDHIKNSKGELVAHHMWFTYNSSFSSLGVLKKGEQLIIKAQPINYKKGVWREKRDCKLSQPTTVQALNNIQHAPMPKKKEAVIGYIMENNKMENSGHYSTAYQNWLKKIN